MEIGGGALGKVKAVANKTHKQPPALGMGFGW